MLATAEEKAHGDVISKLEGEMVDLLGEESKLQNRMFFLRYQLKQVREKQSSLHCRTEKFQKRVDFLDSQGPTGSLATEFSRGDSAERSESTECRQ